MKTVIVILGALLMMVGTVGPVQTTAEANQRGKSISFDLVMKGIIGPAEELKQPLIFQYYSPEDPKVKSYLSTLSVPPNYFAGKTIGILAGGTIQTLHENPTQLKVLISPNARSFHTVMFPEIPRGLEIEIIEKKKKK